MERDMTTLQSHQDVKACFEPWAIRRQAIESNRPLHEEARAAVREKQNAIAPRRLRILDLGCGDAGVIRHAADLMGLAAYCGIDPSESALALARQALEPRVGDLKLICGDIAHEVGCLDGSFDVIMAGYSLHHLDAAGKEHVLGACRRLLAEGGVMIICDLLRRDDETRDSFVLRFAMRIVADCPELEVHERSAMARHILDRDRPETRGWWEAAAARAGYGGFACRRRDDNELYAVLELAG